MDRSSRRSIFSRGSRAPRALVPAAAVAMLAALAACSAANPGDASSSDATADAIALAGIGSYGHADVCGAADPGSVRCHAKVRTDASGNATTSAKPAGFGPPDLQSAYKLTSSVTSGALVAIVDAFDDPTAESDLATYRSTFGLPPCTTANGCFRKLTEAGQTTGLPAANTGWSQEISLDLDMVSAVCPSCDIVLLEANSTSLSDLGAAVNTAAKLGAVAISNSYGGSESAGSASAASQFYNHPGIAVTASSGDNGFGVEFPASAASVIAVGGTSLAKSTSSRGWAEGAWSKAGSGCSARIAKPSWQTDTGCANRTVADVSAVADPNTGVAVFFNGKWLVFGGTSAASPIVAGVLASTGRASSGASFLYAHTADLFDVTSGSNGTCSPAYLCTGETGYDGPTGLGTPNGAALATGATGATTQDAGTAPVDSGKPLDSGTITPIDSGARDTGTATPVDSGAPVDSGKPVDSGAPIDSGRPADSGTTTVDAGKPVTPAGAVTAAITFASQWNTGYCANLVVTNGGTAAIATWTAQVDLNQSTIASDWSADYGITGSAVTVSPLSYDAAIAPGASVTVGFCGNDTGTNWQPTVTSVSGS